MASQDVDGLDRALGENLLFDGRVSEKRAEQFYAVTGEPRTARDLRRALTLYVEYIAANDPRHTYACPDLNAANLIGAPSQFHLGHTVNLTSCLRRIRTKLEKEAAALKHAEQEICDFIPRPEADDTSVKSVVNEIFRLTYNLNQNRPVWAGRWDQLARASDRGDPSSWSRSLGVRRPKASLEMVLRYSAKGLALARPTQLDIGDYAFHFPSPPSLHNHLGGFTLHLGEASREVRLISEYIHPPRQFTFDDWKRGGFLVGQGPNTIDALTNIRLFRKNHLPRLRRAPAVIADPDALRWLERLTEK